MGWPMGWLAEASRSDVCLVAWCSLTVGGAIAFFDGHPVLAQPIALRSPGARRLRRTPKMGDTTANEGRCEKEPAEVLGASRLC